MQAVCPTLKRRNALNDILHQPGASSSLSLVSQTTSIGVSTAEEHKKCPCQVAAAEKELTKLAIYVQVG
jgi:hypothetical protein